MSTTVSSKYQIVIPKSVRKQLYVKPGQKVNVQATKDGRIILEKDSSGSAEAFIKKYAGSIKTADTAWGKAGLDASEWIRKMRDEEWNK